MSYTIFVMYRWQILIDACFKLRYVSMMSPQPYLYQRYTVIQCSACDLALKLRSSSDPHQLTFYLACIPTFISGILSDILCDILHSQLRSGGAHDLALAVEVRQCPLSSGAVPTDIWRSRLRSGCAHARGWGCSRWGRILGSGSAHWNLAVAVEVAEVESEAEEAEGEAGGGTQHLW